MNVLVVDDGSALRGFDCRDVLKVEEIPGAERTPRGERFLVRLGRRGCEREMRCRRVLGFFSLGARDIRPLPGVLAERMTEELPWGVGIIGEELCLLY